MRLIENDNCTYHIEGRRDIYLWLEDSKELGTIAAMARKAQDKSQKYIYWRINFDTYPRQFQIRIDPAIDSNTNFVSLIDAVEFLQHVKQKYPEDLDLFLYHPELFLGRFLE